MQKFDPKEVSQTLLNRVNLKSLSVIEIQRQDYSKDLNCLNNANEYVLIHGGEVQFGWLLTIIGNVVLQLTGHTVVKRKDGTLLCVTLNENRQKSVKFVLDNTVEKLAVGQYLPAKFFALINNERINEYIGYLARHNKLRLSGADNSSSEIQNINAACQQLYPTILSLAKKYTARNDYCFCGSGIKAKKCCG
ncbi:SEC-C domain-containing protein [Pseudoalteromonas sp. SG43-7]|uniref:SEC-C metal-binding domain-containing protein n=1 Tax=unclassified Pseudoalteromonas TaxID=194690 RepID=UPI001601BB1F|nr:MULTISPECIES: SEC-C metal-binding domain-containing protein [unclassified Pseudoalteromonas]MBB1294513.1 SEC-C domain-containing protein [Pseudoalteromonas sp. SR41-4]MBB1420317.1 SEC-C domain-containing protein [Pseudoalteromonas sp. SG43-7]